MAQRSARPARRGRAAAAALLALGAAWCFAPSAGAGGARTASGGGLRAKGEQLEYFDVYTKEEFLQLLDGSRADQRSIGEQEKIERMVSFLEMQNPMQRPAESMQLVGRWRLSFCGVNRGLQVQPALEAQKESQAGEIQSVSLEIAQDYSLKTEVVLGPNSVLVARQSPLKKPPPRGEVLKEEAGFKRYVKVTYLDDDLLILRGRAASEVYRKA